MEKFIPYEKLSKKEKRKMDLAKRQTWGELNPVTRKPTNSKAYNRKRTQDWKRELPDLRRPHVEFCVSEFRQTQEYHVINVHDGGLFPLSIALPVG